MLDVRVPIGWLFIVYGGMLVVWGLFRPVQIELGAGMASFNLNLIWGGLMLAFGVCMKVFSDIDTRKSKAAATESDKSN